jgi:hypothetical protein
LFHAQGKAGQAVGDQVDPHDLGREQGQGQPEQGGQEHDPDLGRAAAETVADEAAQVVVDAPTLADGADDGGEGVVGQDHVGGLLGDLGAGLAHGHPDVGPAQGGGVIHAVAGHGHYLPAGLPGLDDVELLLGGGAGVHRDVGHMFRPDTRARVGRVRRR